jgi:uncharacterized protein (TIGR00369 family)
MDVTDNRYCFICGELNPIGLKTRPEIDPERRSAICRLTIPAEFQGWEGVVHGGVIAALLDEVSAYAAMTISKQVVTAELHTRYLKPVPVDVEIVVSAVVREQKRRSLVIDAELVRDETVLARSEARMVIFKDDKLLSSDS